MADDEPEYGKQYLLIGGIGEKAISNGNSWEESVVTDEMRAKAKADAAKVPGDLYTRGWEGAKYKDTKDLPLKEIAKRIKAECKEKYPGANVSVRTEHYSMGCAINISINDPGFNPYNPKYDPNDYSINGCSKRTEGPFNQRALDMKDAISKIADQYNYDNSDGMIDYFDTNFYCGVAFAYDLDEKYPKPWAKPEELEQLQEIN